jgi:N-acetylglucosamine kinase-like BadF-type ATPase
MKYLIGIDGGGTKTKCMAADFEGKPVYETTGGPSNFLVYGLDNVSETIFNLLTNCTKKLNCSFENIAAIVIGTAGAGRKEDAERLRQTLLKIAETKDVAIKKLRVESDARITLEGAFSSGPGSVIIAGTGSIMLGKDSQGKIHRVGGFGRLIGDEGSGYHIGKKGLTALSKFYDGRGNPMLLSELVLKHFNISSDEELIKEVYRNNLDIASVAQLVIYAAEKDDPICVKIIDEESDELILHIQTMKKNLKEDTFNLSFAGSIISTDNFFSRTLRKKIVDRFTDVKITEPEQSPLIGAILIAKEYLQH